MNRKQWKDESPKPSSAIRMHSNITMEQLEFYLYGKRPVLPVVAQETMNGIDKEKSKIATETDILQLRYKPGVTKEFSCIQQFDQVLKLMRNMPKEVQLCYSSIPHAGFGVCAKEMIPSGSCFGPYQGKHVSVSEAGKWQQNNKMWEMYKNGKVDHYVMADGSTRSDWMKYLQCARNANEQNTTVFQFGPDIYFQTSKKIKVGEEILVWYAESYEKHFGIPISERNNPLKGVARKASWADKPSTITPPAASSVSYGQAPLPANNPPSRKQQQGKIAPDSYAPIMAYETGYIGRNRFYKCETCKSTFPQKLALKVHKCSSRGLQTTSYCQCSLCYKTFINGRDLEVHANKCNLKSNRYKCGYCPRTFVCEDNLSKHIRVHSRKKLLNGRTRRGRISNYEKLILANQRYL